MIALGIMAFSVVSKSGETGVGLGSLIPERNTLQMGQRFTTQLIRGIVEMRFFETGRYPESLKEIESEVLEESRSLTPSRLADYYYAVRDDEVVLLAPVQ